jgi:hypothetical protein
LGGADIGTGHAILTGWTFGRSRVRLLFWRTKKGGRRMKLLSCLVLASVAVSSVGADATELKVFTARALATVLEVVGPQFEKTSGHKLNIIVGFTPEYAPRIKAGEAFDLLNESASGNRRLYQRRQA